MRSACLLVLLCLTAAPARAAAPLRVPGEALVAVAQDALVEAAQRAGVVVDIEPASKPRALELSGAVQFELQPEVPADWLRPRLAVPVLALVAGKPQGRVLVWLALSAPAQAPVYAQAYVRGTDLAQVQLVTGPVDRARIGAKPALDAGASMPRRLRRNVAAGQPALDADVEALPAVLARQGVQVESVQGPVRIRIAGRALADGSVGETISVLPAGADRPVRARVISPQVVSVEN